MTDNPCAVLPYVNSIEPPTLLDTFLQHPPQGFSAWRSAQGVSLFSTRFDLLTTVDAPLRQRIQGWPGFRWWGRLLAPETCFVGSTVNEYALLPGGLSPDELAGALRRCAPGKALTIVKDLPQASPLLSEADNRYSAQLYEACLRQGFIGIEGQALAWMALDFTDTDQWLARLSRSRRRNIRRKLRSREALRIEVLPTGDPRFDCPAWRYLLYQLYLAVYRQSDIHFDLLTPEFFGALLREGSSGGRVFLYWHDQTLVGYNLCYLHGDKLIDKYIGLNYPLALEYNLYVVSWQVNLEYALRHGLRYYVAGWTDPEVKASLGASFTLTRHLVWVANPLLRRVLNHFRHHFESDARWHQETRS